MNTEERIKEIFAQALERKSRSEREQYLNVACHDDPELRREIESLLRAAEQAGDFLHPTIKVTESNFVSEIAGTRIGRYKLLEQIGEGGFGVVWMAEQEEPMRRRVALKIIKLGMDTREVVARFEAERQALAMMDHPNIASVFDGGATDMGRPFFVMELVKGIPITQFCDERKLTTRERLGLFMQVCQAVQHAHQKGLIHRDLKPTNILVTVKDDRPVPKVIDFGVAKATQARLTEKTLFTRFQQWIGTPAYMSPEQAGLGSLDVDTRSDVYSLGVLLYELLTGRPPFDMQKLLATGYDAVMRTIREDEPPKPSTRLSTLADDELNTVAAQRGSEPAKLGRLVHGELDWIVMKAMEKDRTRRYETVTSLTEDVRRYLSQEPILALAPSRVYRLAKFARRNRKGLFMTLAFTLVLLAGAGTSVWQLLRVRHAQRNMQAERRQSAMDKAWLAAWDGDLEAAEASIRDAELAGASVDEVRMVLGALAIHRGNYDEAILHLDQAVKLISTSVAANSLLSLALMRVGQIERAQQALQAASVLPPATYEDHLFKGMAQAELDPAAGLATLELALHRRDSVVARLIRAQVRLRAAGTTGSLPDAQAAIVDANVVKELVPDNPVVLATSLMAQLVAADIYQDSSEFEKRSVALQMAKADAAALQRYSNNVQAAWARIVYLKYVDDDQSAIEELRQATAHFENSVLASAYAAHLYSLGEFEEALHALARSTREPGATASFCRGYVLADLPNGRERAALEFRTLSERNPSALNALYYQTILRLLGLKQEAVAACLKLREQPGGIVVGAQWYRQILEYCCDRMSADELLRAAGMAKMHLCEAHFFIALTSLAEGRRQTAEEHFRKAVATRAVYSFDYSWSHAFLARLEHDPAWPPWISVKPFRESETRATKDK